MAEAVIPIVLTIFVDPNSVNKTRISRVSSHGEEIIDPGPEVSAVCGYIYQHLAKAGPLDTQDIRKSLVEATLALESVRTASMEPLSKVAEAINLMAGILGRLNDIEKLLKERVLTVAAT